MGTFGERLQREREMRGITLEEIAEATKIGTRSLRALEEQDFDKLPGGIFNKGFVRAYSKYLGIDEDQAVADYQTAVNEAQASGKLTRPEYTAPKLEETEEESEPVRVPWGLLILIALVVVVGFAARSYYAQHGWAKLRRQPTPSAKAAQPTRAPANAEASPDPVAATPVSDSGTPGEPAPKQSQSSTSPAVMPAAKAEPSKNAASTAKVEPSKTVTPTDGFVVKIRAIELAWVSITADGKNVFTETMQPNSDHKVHAAKEVVVVTGNAAGIELSHNDKLIPTLGEEGQKKTVVLTAQGVQQP